MTYWTTDSSRIVYYEIPSSDTGWSKCYYSPDAKGLDFMINCENNAVPYLRQFAITSGNNYGVALQEVEIHGMGEHFMKYSQYLQQLL